MAGPHPAIAQVTAIPPAATSTELFTLPLVMKFVLILAALNALVMTFAKADDTGARYIKSPGVPAAAADGTAPFVVSRHRIQTFTEKQVSYAADGRRLIFEVVIITFKDVYNTGATRIYTKTFRATEGRAGAAATEGVGLKV